MWFKKRYVQRKYIFLESQCEYKNAQCKAMKDGNVLSFTSYGACITIDTTCDVVMQAKCIPHQIATLTGTSGAFEAICGSNNITYGKVTNIKIKILTFL